MTNQIESPNDNPATITCTHLNNFLIEDVVNFWNHSRYPSILKRPVSIDMLERQIFAKAFFDPNGFIIAWKNGQVVGFAHAGFGLTSDCSQVDYSTGVIPLICYNDCDSDDILDALIIACEKYLIGKGAATLQLGAYFPQAPFYLGLMRCSTQPGIFLDEQTLVNAAIRHGYVLNSASSHYRHPLNNISWTFDHNMRALRRKYNVQMDFCPTPAQWGVAIAMNGIVWSRLSLIEAGCGMIHAEESIAQCSLWVIDDIANSDRTIVGISQGSVEPQYRGQQIGLFLLTEAMRKLLDQQVAAVELQVLDCHSTFIQNLEDKGFELFRHSALFTKDSPTIQVK